MRQIGGEQSALFSLTTVELVALEERVANGQLEPPLAIHRQGPAGGLARFRSFDDAILVKLAIT